MHVCCTRLPRRLRYSCMLKTDIHVQHLEVACRGAHVTSIPARLPPKHNNKKGASLYQTDPSGYHSYGIQYYVFAKNVFLFFFCCNNLLEYCYYSLYSVSVYLLEEVEGALCPVGRTALSEFGEVSVQYILERSMLRLRDSVPPMHGQSSYE